MPALVASYKRHPGSLAERFWSLAHSGPPAEAAGPQAIVRRVHEILDALAAGEMGDGVSQCSLSFLALLRQSQEQGDFSYASPEQARGESVDERSLVFSVGVLLFEELTGRHPFGQTTARRFARIKKGELGSGVQYFPQVPTELRSMLVQAMGPFPEERFASLAELRLALEAFLVGPPPRLDEEEQTQTFRRPVLFAPGIVLPADAFAPPPIAPARLRTTSKTRRSRRTVAVAERMGWLALGVVAALVVTRLPLRSAPIAVAAPPVAVAAPPVAVAAPPVAVVAPPVGDPLVLEAPAPAQLATPTIEFDAAAAANAGAQAAHKCFEPMDHSIAFGAGLLFAPEDAKIHRAFLSPDEPLSPEARRCVQKALVGASAGAPPDARVIVEARFKLRPDGSIELKLHPSK